MSKPKFKRASRMAELLRESIGTLMLREISDPRLLNITITRVEVGDDMQTARVYCRALDGNIHEDQNRQRALDKAFTKATSFFRRELGKRLHIKRVPELRFLVDYDLDKRNRIDNLLANIDDVDLPEASHVEV